MEERALVCVAVCLLQTSPVGCCYSTFDACELQVKCTRLNSVLVLLQGSEVVYNPQTPNLGGAPGTGKAGAGKITSINASAVNSPGSAVGTPTGYMGGLAPIGSKVRRKSGAFTSGAVTHPASLAAAGKPTGLEEMISSPSFTRNASTTAAGHQTGL